MRLSVPHSFYPESIAERIGNRLNPVGKILAVLFGTVALAGCGPSLKEQNEDLRSDLGELQAQLYDVRSKASDLQAAVGDLEEQVGSFDDENWRDVVPRVTSATEAVKAAAEETVSATAEM